MVPYPHTRAPIPLHSWRACHALAAVPYLSLSASSLSRNIWLNYHLLSLHTILPIPFAPSRATYTLPIMFKIALRTSIV